jgi:hypothetical protein
MCHICTAAWPLPCLLLVRHNAACHNPALLPVMTGLEGLQSCVLATTHSHLGPAVLPDTRELAAQRTNYHTPGHCPDRVQVFVVAAAPSHQVEALMELHLNQLDCCAGLVVHLKCTAWHNVARHESSNTPCLTSQLRHSAVALRSNSRPDHALECSNTPCA